MTRTTILITLMGLDIGGAETHVLALSKHLHDMGYKVLVASRGGAYEQEIEQYGIKHYRVDLSSKHPLQVIRSLRQLAFIVRTEQVDLIHAHARIPAFISRLISKCYHIPFITTAHAQFKYTSLLRYLSVWGDRTIAVSNDIKEHLVNKFGVKPELITVINNGIDTAQFCPGLEYAELVNELQINDTYNKVVSVSRIDDELGDFVLGLIDAMVLVSEQCKDMYLVIAGSGNRLEEVQGRSRAVNEALGRNLIYILGKRTDINRVLSLATVFVGISRAAMEAMACKKPVILAGPWSYVGLLDELNLLNLQEDNFTGRSFDTKFKPELLAAEIERVLRLSAAERSGSATMGRQIVTECYSSLKMTEQTAKVYEDILAHR